MAGAAAPREGGGGGGELCKIATSWKRLLFFTKTKGC